jgi:hypothetical protein
MEEQFLKQNGPLKCYFEVYDDDGLEKQLTKLNE